MANQFGLFWNSENHDRLYDADSFEEWLKKFFTTGVFNGDLMVESAGSMVVTVGTGYANVNGKVRFFDTVDNVTLNPANGTYPRIDTIVVERNDTDREISLKYVQGDYSGATPSATAPVRTANIYQIVLAQIYVGVGATEITQANITDTRANSALCGWVVGTVDEVDVSQMTAQVQADFLAWYDSMKDQLSQDAAGRLQLEIDDINDTLPPKVYDYTLSASAWNEYNNININLSAITATNVVTITYYVGITIDIYEAMRDADIRVINQNTGVVTLKALGTAPSVDIPIKVIIQKEAQ